MLERFAHEEDASILVRDLRNTFAIPLVFFFLFVGVGAVQPYIVPYLKGRHGLSPLQASMVVATVYFVFGFARFFSGFVIKAIQKKPTIMLGALGYFCFVLVLRYGHAFSTFLMGSVMWGVAAGLIWTASSTQVLDAATEDRFGRASGVLLLFAKFGITIGVVVLGWALAGEISMRQLSSVYVEKNAATDYTAFFRISLSFGGLAVLLTLLVPYIRVEVDPPRMRYILRFFSHLSNWLVPAVLFVSFFSYGFMLTLFNQYIKEQWGIHRVMPITFCFMFSGVCVTYVAGWLSDRVGRGPVLAGSFAAGALAQGILAVEGGPWLAALAACLLGFQFGGVPTVANAWVGDRSTEVDRPTAHACAFAWRDFGIAIAALMGGWLRQQGIGFRYGFAAFGLIFLAAAGASVLVARRE